MAATHRVSVRHGVAALARLGADLGVGLQVGGDGRRRGGQRDVPVLGAPGGEAGPVLAVVAGGVRRHRPGQQRGDVHGRDGEHGELAGTGVEHAELVEQVEIVVDGGHARLLPCRFG
ncbi:MAG TPA: hypothetical protein VIU87_23365 [Mycobacterium sp.]